MLGIAGIPGRGPAAVVAFPGGSSRPTRPALGSDEPRGEILLFTGVRYERAVDDAGALEQGAPLQPIPPAGTAPRRRRS